MAPTALNTGRSVHQPSVRPIERLQFTELQLHCKTTADFLCHFVVVVPEQADEREALLLGCRLQPCRGHGIFSPATLPAILALPQPQKVLLS